MINSTLSKIIVSLGGNNMHMESFVITVGEFLRMSGQKVLFDPNKINYVIPKYQREYKWSDERVATLITDVKKNSKFLGNIILNAVDNHYELVDGQQRITTIVLILSVLFNINKHASKDVRTEEQKKLVSFLFRDNSKFILENESIGDYISLSETEIALTIKKDDDIYFQTNRFRSLFNLIGAQVSKISNENLLDFQNKLLDCKILVLIGTPEGKEQDSIEEVFLDINFKSQLLDVANIFKGYCFKNYDAVAHTELKRLWTSIRSNTKQFESRFGYEETRETCEYLYLFLLSVPDSYKILANLSPGGIHYLENKNHTETKELLEDMVEYGNCIIAFDDNISNTNYYFSDLCNDADNHKKEETKLHSLRSMASKIMNSKDAQYYKLPFFMLVYYLTKDNQLSSSLEYTTLKSFITNFYVYAFLFINSGKSKNKTLIAYDFLDRLHSNDASEKIIENALDEIRKIRKDFLDEFSIFRTFSANRDKAYACYSIMDHYSAKDNFIEQIYSEKNDYTPEHFLVHDNKFMAITWVDGKQTFSFSLRDLLGQPDGKSFKALQYKRQTSNYVVLPRKLNESIGQDDISSKIHNIKEYYKNSKTKVIEMPTHIKLFFNHIENMDTYKKLAALKGKGESQTNIKKLYAAFVNNYFSEETQASLYQKLESQFKSTFHNH